MPLFPAACASGPPARHLCRRPCRHPAIPCLYNYFFDDDGSIELVTDLMEGELVLLLGGERGGGEAAVVLPVGWSYSC